MFWSSPPQRPTKRALNGYSRRSCPASRVRCRASSPTHAPDAHVPLRSGVPGYASAGTPMAAFHLRAPPQVPHRHELIAKVGPPWSSALVSSRSNASCSVTTTRSALLWGISVRPARYGFPMPLVAMAIELAPIQAGTLPQGTPPDSKTAYDTAFISIRYGRPVLMLRDTWSSSRRPPGGGS